MAKLIVKSPYLKCSGADKVSGYLHYIGTCEHVQKLSDDRPPTRKQEQLIAKLLKDFPAVKELDEYSDYARHKTKANASAFFTMALEENWSEVNRSEVYAKYIATRPRAERMSSHGLFGDEDDIDLDQAMAELDAYTGNVWTHIISLKREDAARLGYENAQAWRNLIRTHRNDIAAAMKIPPKDFRWYAAFHNEGEHPHIHMMAWSAKPGQAYLSRDGIRQMKSLLINDIFKQELLHIYEQKSESRNELVRQARESLLELTQAMTLGVCDHPDIEPLFMQLAQKMDAVNGKKSCGYLPKSVKAIVDSIVNQMEGIPAVAQCYDRWLELQGQVDGYYGGEERKRLRLSQQKEFRAIKNAVIQEAEHIRLGKISFEDTGMDAGDAPDNEDFASYDYWSLKEIILDDSETLEDRDAAIEEMKQLAENGDTYAQYFLGTLYRDGGLLIPDSELARGWFYKAAQQGLVSAQYQMGKLLLSDDALVYDGKLGMEWLEYAAGNGSDAAAYRLGREYLKGDIIGKDMTKAVGYFKSAANDGNQHAQYMLGKLALENRDRVSAKYWFTLSADQGNEYAQFFLDRMDSIRPPSVMLAATRLLHHMANIFRVNSLPRTSPMGMKIDRKRLRQLREKKIALGHKADDHEEYQGPTMMM